MSIFGNLTNEGLEETTDRLGGFQIRTTDIYPATIKAAYAGQSAGGARNVTIVAELPDGEYSETIYVTNKKGENWFPNQNDKSKKVPLPGFTTIDDICLVTTGKPLAEQETEEKTIKLYDSEAKKELPKAVPMLVEALGLEVSLGIVKVLENKNEKQGDEYVPTAETRELNATDKVFHTETRMTVVEAREGAEVAKFWDSWLERNKGNTRDKRTIKDGQAGTAGAPKAAGASAAAPAAGGAPRKSLFGK